MTRPSTQYPKTARKGDRVKITAYGEVTYVDSVERTAVVMTEGYTQQALVLPLYMLAVSPPPGTTRSAPSPADSNATTVQTPTPSCSDGSQPDDVVLPCGCVPPCEGHHEDES